MGQLTQAPSTMTHPVRHALSGWRSVPVLLGTAAALAGCAGAGGHSAPRAAAGVSTESRVAVSSAHPAMGQAARAPRVAASSAHRRRAIRRAAAAGQTGHRVRVTIRRSAAKHTPHVAVPSAHHHGSTPPATVSEASVTSQTGAGVPVTIPPASTKGSDVRSAATRPGATIRTITGSDNATIGTLAESTSVFLVWTASDGPIQIFTSQGNLLLSSHAPSGKIRLAPGRYSGLRVASQGAWTLTLHAAA